MTDNPYEKAARAEKVTALTAALLVSGVTAAEADTACRDPRIRADAARAAGVHPGSEQTWDDVNTALHKALDPATPGGTP